MRNKISAFGIVFGFTWCTLVAFLLFLALTACTPLRRLDRLQKQHPYLFDRLTDTVRIQDTVSVTIPGTAVDTFFTMRNLIDTIRFQKDNLSVQAYVLNDTLYLSAKTDTIYKQVIRKLTIPVTKYVYAPKPRDKLRWLPLIIIALLVGCIKVQYEMNRAKEKQKAKNETEEK